MLFLLKNPWIQKIIALLIFKIVVFIIIYYFFYKDYKTITNKEVVFEHLFK